MGTIEPPQPYCCCKITRPNFKVELNTSKLYYSSELVAIIEDLDWVFIKPKGSYEFKVLQHYGSKIGNPNTIGLTRFIQMHCQPGHSYEVSELTHWLTTMVGNTAKLMVALGRTSVHKKDNDEDARDRSAFSPLSDIFDTVEMLVHWQGDNLFKNYVD